MEIINIVMSAGRSAVELALFILLPIMVIMLAIMRLLEAAGVVDHVVRWLTPLLRPAGLTGFSVFALLQASFVSFAAPLATLTTMERRGSSDRHLAATLAMVLALGQANVVFPLVTLGLDLGRTLLFSLLGGLTASVMTYYFIARHLSADEQVLDEQMPHAEMHNPQGVLAVINHAGSEAFRIATGSIPMLALSLLAVGLIREAGGFALLESLLSPLLDLLGISPLIVMPTLTKYLAGGTAGFGLLMDLQKQGLIDQQFINQATGWLIHSLDVPGVAILISAGPRVAKVWKLAVAGACCGILLRAACHVWL